MSFQAAYSKPVVANNAGQGILFLGFLLVTIGYLSSCSCSVNVNSNRSGLYFMTPLQSKSKSYYDSLKIRIGSNRTMLQYDLWYENLMRRFRETVKEQATEEATTTTLRPEPTTLPLHLRPTSSQMMAKIFAGIATTIFVLTFLVIVIKTRATLRDKCLSIPVIRDLRDISEFERFRRAQARMELEGMADAEPNLELVFPFILRRLKNEQDVLPPPSYAALFRDHDQELRSNSNDGTEEQPPSYASAMTCGLSERSVHIV